VAWETLGLRAGLIAGLIAGQPCTLTAVWAIGTMYRMVAGEAGNLVAQMRRGVLPYCVLAMLQDKERYGFELVHALSAVDGMVTGEGTIYPLLARLRRQGRVETTWQESASGPPRRYYRITSSGRDALTEFAGSWRRFRGSVDDLLASPEEDTRR
jgi:PadR family transcriptional regulator, regulatory protein PadR